MNLHRKKSLAFLYYFFLWLSVVDLAPKKKQILRTCWTNVIKNPRKNIQTITLNSLVKCFAPLQYLYFTGWAHQLYATITWHNRDLHCVCGEWNKISWRQAKIAYRITKEILLNEIADQTGTLRQWNLSAGKETTKIQRGFFFWPLIVQFNSVSIGSNGTILYDQLKTNNCIQFFAFTTRRLYKFVCACVDVLALLGANYIHSIAQNSVASQKFDSNMQTDTRDLTVFGLWQWIFTGCLIRFNTLRDEHTTILTFLCMTQKKRVFAMDE